MENGSKNVLEFSQFKRKKENETEKGNRIGKNNVIETDLDKEKEIKDLQKELEELQREQKNVKAKILLGNETSGEKAYLRRQFMYKLDEFKGKVNQMTDSLHYIIFGSEEEVAERKDGMLGKLLKIEKAIGVMREEIWEIFKTRS